MKIAQLTPGSGDNFYCENCLRDVGLVKALRKGGHEVLMMPMYLPVNPEKTDPVSNTPLFFGGVNVYLQQKLEFFRKTPRWVDRVFDSAKLLGWAGKRAGMTSAKLLGETTVSMLQGRDGRQMKELDRLVDWMALPENRPDIVCLSNILIAGLAGSIRERLGVPVVCLLQDEDGFLDGLGEPYAGQAWGIVSKCVGDIDAFIAVSEYYADVMRERLSVDAEKVHVAYSGVSLEGFESLRLYPEVPTIGYLSRMCPDRGLDTLVEAFIMLKKKDEFKDVRLKIAGGKSGSDEGFIRGLQKNLAAEGVIEDVEFVADLGRDAKLSFLRGLSVLSVPEKRPVACGLYVLEALAAGVCVVEPAFGVFNELADETGGCVLYEPNDAATLAETLGGLLGDTERVRGLGVAGKEAVFEKFDVCRTAGEMVRIFDDVLRQFSRG
jgi:glycosyltransferase involved in cell wall biosynthesis